MRYVILNVFEPHELKIMLRRAGIRQYDLAKSVGISQSYLSKMLLGHVEMPKEVEGKIESILSEIKQKNPIWVNRK
jgi:predicted transcriptional regulator